MAETLVRDDLNAVIVYEAESHALTFTAYEQCGWSEHRKPGELAGLWYELKSDGAAVEQTQDISLAQPMIEGFIKWDGCSQYTFGEGGYLHLCGASYVEKFAALTVAIFALAAEKVPHWNAGVAGVLSATPRPAGTDGEEAPYA